MATESTPGQDLARFCAQLEDYTPTVCFKEKLSGALRIFLIFLFFSCLSVDPRCGDLVLSSEVWFPHRRPSNVCALSVGLSILWC